jgi:DNA-binding response OmpR family regulator/Txe/YoeB family toxin of Txe-Axe toxin-antitoxin module
MEMNSDPSGTDEGIAVPEDAIDIFIVCGNSTDALQLEQQLAPMEYRVTLFTGTASLLESLRAGKPNLLICDITGPEQDGSEICREIKADDDLWRVPVLLITGISSLSDLLVVLDSNADNFIARPYDPQYLLSLIDAMLASPVEKPDPEKIKTQFKIRQDDRDYVIMADRRKLLEFLLSSFEIAIGRHAEQVRVQQELDALAAELEHHVTERTKNLSNEAARLEALVKEHTRSRSLTESALQEQKNEAKNLHVKIEEYEREIATTKEEIARLSQDLESNRSRLAEAETTIRNLASEKDELEHALRGDTEVLNRDLEQSRADLERIRHQLQEEVEHRTVLDTRCSELTRDHEEAKKVLEAQATELEQLRSALAAEKIRGANAEEKIRAVLQERSRSEQDLRQLLRDVTEKAERQSQENQRLADDLAAEQSRRTEVEHRIEVLHQEIAKKEIALVAEKGSIQEHRDLLQQKFDALTESFGAERQKCTSLESDVKSLKISLEERDGDLRTLSRQLEEANTTTEREKQQRLCAEKTLKETVGDRDEELLSLRSANEKLREELNAKKTELATVLRDRENAKGSQKDLEDRLDAVMLGRAESEKLVRAISAERDQLRDELGNEQHLRRSAEDRLNQVIEAKEKVERDLYTLTEERATEETSRQTKTQKDKDDRETMLSRQKSLEAMLIAAEKEQAEKEAAFQALSGELEQAMAQLEAETEKRRSVEEDLVEIRKEIPRNKPVTPTTALKEMPEDGHAIIVKEADLPAVFDSGPQEVALTDASPAELAVVRDEQAPPLNEEPKETSGVEIRSVEDLYEQPHELDINDLPDAAPVAADNRTAEAGAVEESDITLENGEEAGEEEPDMATLPEPTGTTAAAGLATFSRQQWFDLVKWARNTPALSHEDRLRIVRLGRLIQKGRRLTRRQEAQLSELVTLASSMGYRPNN